MILETARSLPETAPYTDRKASPGKRRSSASCSTGYWPYFSRSREGWRRDRHGRNNSWEELDPVRGSDPCDTRRLRSCEAIFAGALSIEGE